MSKAKQSITPATPTPPAAGSNRAVVLNVNKNVLFALTLALGAVIMLGAGFLVGNALFRPRNVEPQASAAVAAAGQAAAAGAANASGLPSGIQVVPRQVDPNALHPNLEGFVAVSAAEIPIAEGAPRIQVRGVDQKGTLDMGTIQPGEKREYTFDLANIGKGDLVINQMYTSCGCTLANFAGRKVTDAPFDPPVIVKPGESLPLVIEYDTAVNQDKGRVDKFVQVFSNDPVAKDIKEAFRETRFRMTGVVGQED